MQSSYSKVNSPHPIRDIYALVIIILHIIEVTKYIQVCDPWIIHIVVLSEVYDSIAIIITKNVSRISTIHNQPCIMHVV